MGRLAIVIQWVSGFKSMRIMIVDDHELMRRGVRTLLEARDHEVCCEAIDGNDAIVKAQQLKPDIIIMDLSLPTVGGVEATLRILNILPKTKMIIFSQHASMQLAEQVFRIGACGLVVKSAASQDLLAAIDNVGRRERFLSPSIRKESVVGGWCNDAGSV
jgi:DNA-binding NarL/FixJ family response regulator